MDEPSNAAVGNINSTQEKMPSRALTKVSTQEAAEAEELLPIASSRTPRSTNSFVDAINRGDFSSVLAIVRRQIRRLKCAIDKGKIMDKILKYNEVMKEVILCALNEKSFSMEQKNNVARVLQDDGLFELLSKYWIVLDVKDDSQWLANERKKEWRSKVSFLDYVMDATIGCITICDADHWTKEFKALALFCLDVLRSSALRNFVQSGIQTNILQKTLSTVHLLAQKYNEFSEWMRDNSRASEVAHYMPHPALLVMTEATLLSSRIVSRDEGELKKVRYDLILKAVGMLRDCLKSTSKTHHSEAYGYKALDVLRVLNRLAEDDDDKKTVAACGGLELYGQLLADDCDAAEHKEACNGLWILAYDEENKKRIKDDERCMQGLRKLRSSYDSAVKDAANGALWVVENEDMRVQKSKASQKNKTREISTDRRQLPRIMISYSWKHKAEVLRIKNRLENTGYSIWIDVEQMSGSILESMADAVEQAAVVLMFCSEHYKASRNCRSEAEYCYKIDKPIIPIILQRGYKADGWLGIISASKYYFDFTRNETWESTFENLCKEINKLITKEEESTVVVTPVSELLLSREIGDIHPPAAQSAESWTAAEVQKWLEDHDLAQSSGCFTGFTGAHVLEMRHMQQSAPSFFYRLLNKKLQLPVKEIVTLSMLLRKLK